MLFITLVSIASFFGFETLPHLLSFHLFDRLRETADTRFSYTLLDLPARAVLTTDFRQCARYKEEHGKSLRLSICIITCRCPPMRAYR